MVADLIMIEKTPDDQKSANALKQGAYVIVFGNEKGGSGKSTSAMHVAIALIRLGYKVGTIDLDARQGTLTRYMKNRWDFVFKSGKDTPSPQHMAIEKSKAPTVEEQQDEDLGFLMMALDEFSKTCDFVVIDTPGTDSYLSALAHYHADAIVTPLNDSFIDLDVLVRLEGDSGNVSAPSVYSKMVFEQMKKRELEGRDKPRWIVMRNRLTHLHSQNKRKVGKILSQTSQEFGFDIVPGFGERVIFKELFPKGLTLLDLKEDEGRDLSFSELAARQEVRQLVRAIGPQDVKGYVRPLT